jgi:hypothetical protein
MAPCCACCGTMPAARRLYPPPPPRPPPRPPYRCARPRSSPRRAVQGRVRPLARRPIRLGPRARVIAQRRIRSPPPLPPSVWAAWSRHPARPTRAASPSTARKAGRACCTWKPRPGPHPKHNAAPRLGPVCRRRFASVPARLAVRRFRPVPLCVGFDSARCVSVPALCRPCIAQSQGALQRAGRRARPRAAADAPALVLRLVTRFCPRPAGASAPRRGTGGGGERGVGATGDDADAGGTSGGELSSLSRLLRALISGDAAAAAVPP